MKVELRFYKRYDADLLSLHETGVSLSALTKAAVIAYANGQRARYMMPKCKSMNFDDRRTVRLRMSIDDQRTQELLSHIKNSYRNQFCKTVLRDALVTQCIGTYISSSYDLNAENGRLQEMMNDLPEGTVVLNGKKKRRFINDILKEPGTIETPTPRLKEKKDKSKVIDMILKPVQTPVPAPADNRNITDIKDARPKKRTAIPDEKATIRAAVLNGGDNDEPVMHRFGTFEPVPENKNNSNSIDEDFMDMFESITNL